MIRADRILVAGIASGPLLVLEESLNLWNGFDAATGTVLAAGHPQEGQSLAGAIVWLETKGATAGGSLTEALRCGRGPAGVLLKSADTSLAVASTVAAHLYDVECPIFVFQQLPAHFRTGLAVSLGLDGSVVPTV